MIFRDMSVGDTNSDTTDMFKEMPGNWELKTIPPITPSTLLSVSHRSKQGLTQENSIFVLTTGERYKDPNNPPKGRLAKPMYGAWRAYEDVLMQADRVVQSLTTRLNRDKLCEDDPDVVGPRGWMGRVIADKATGQAIANEDVWDEKIIEGAEYSVIVRIHRVRVDGWAQT